MLKVNIEDREYKVCSDWSEILFGQYIDILNIYKDKYTDIEKGLRFIAAMIIDGNKDEFLSDLFKLSPSDFQTLTTYCEWVKEDINKLIDQSSEVKSFEIDGNSYVIKDNYDKLDMGEMLSVELLIQNNKSLDPLEIAFGVLFRKADENGKPVEFSEEEFVNIITGLRNKVKLIDVYKYISFFLRGEKNSTTKNTQGFSVSRI